MRVCRRGSKRNWVNRPGREKHRTGLGMGHFLCQNIQRNRGTNSGIGGLGDEMQWRDDTKKLGWIGKKEGGKNVREHKKRQRKNRHPKKGEKESLAERNQCHVTDFTLLAERQSNGIRWEPPKQNRQEKKGGEREKPKQTWKKPENPVLLRPLCRFSKVKMCCLSRLGGVSNVQTKRLKLKGQSGFGVGTNLKGMNGERCTLPWGKKRNLKPRKAREKSRCSKPGGGGHACQIVGGGREVDRRGGLQPIQCRTPRTTVTL